MVVYRTRTRAYDRGPLSKRRMEGGDEGDIAPRRGRAESNVFMKAKGFRTGRRTTASRGRKPRRGRRM
jgi:hypothetical protein